MLSLCLVFHHPAHSNPPHMHASLGNVLALHVLESKALGGHRLIPKRPKTARSSTTRTYVRSSPMHPPARSPARLPCATLSCESPYHALLSLLSCAYVRTCVRTYVPPSLVVPSLVGHSAPPFAFLFNMYVRRYRLEITKACVRPNAYSSHDMSLR